MTQNLKVQYVNVDEIEVTSFEPPTRVTQKALADLRTEIIKAGEILVPLALTKSGKLADGNRRLAIAKELGYAQVPVIYYDTDNQMALWSWLDSGIKAMRGSDWTQAVAHGLEIDYLPAKLRDPLKEMSRILGPELYQRVLDTKRAPATHRSAMTIASYCNDLSDDFVKACIMWLLDFKQSFVIIRAISAKTSPEVIYSHIVDRLPLEQSWS